MSNVPSNGQSQGLGKSIAALAAGIVTTGVVAVADQYLPKPLPAEAVSMVQLFVTALAVWLVPHDFWSKLQGN